MPPELTPEIPTAPAVPPDADLVEKAIKELAANSGVYVDLIHALSSKQKDPAAISVAFADALKEAGKDASVVIPLVTGVIDSAKEGTQTSEFKMASTVNRVLMYIALIYPFIDGIISLLDGTRFGKSIYVSVIAIFCKACVTIYYTSSRTRVKVAEIQNNPVSVIAPDTKA